MFNYPFTYIVRVGAGLEHTPWLGNLEYLAPASLFLASPSADSQAPAAAPQFPVRAGEKRSYAQSCVVWIKDSGLQVALSSFFFFFLSFLQLFISLTFAVIRISYLL
jgi:hypothetical protein